MRAVALFLVLLLTLGWLAVTVSCSKSSNLVGTWSNSGDRYRDQESITFEKDHTGIIWSGSDGVKIHWQIEDEYLVFAYETSHYSRVPFKLKGDSLTLDQRVFTRVK